MKRRQALTIALTVVCCLLSAFGSVLLAAPVQASTAETATAAAPSPTWLASLAQGTCRLNCTGGTLGHPNSVVIFTTFSTCCSYPGTLCPAGTTPVYGTWQPLSGALQLCPFN